MGLIKAEVLLKKLQRLEPVGGNKYYRMACTDMLQNFIPKLIQEQESVDPFKHGRWLWQEEWKESSSDGPAECEYAGYACSECKIDLAEYLSEALGETIYADNADNPPTIRRCPNCGAIMNEEDLNNEQ